MRYATGIAASLLLAGCGQPPSPWAIAREQCEIPNAEIQTTVQRCGLKIHKTPGGFISDSFNGVNGTITCPNTAIMADGTYRSFSPGCYFDVKNGSTELSAERPTAKPIGSS